ncbi:hypothetical protein HY990_02230 [Candidatus Micrarchaeota archaeon]|nr:hypothetical protein [Candidatus Micrarchaeota archaeon]
MIVGERILEVSGKRDYKLPIAGLSINIALEDITMSGEELEIKYSYHATYEEAAGELKITGVLLAKEDAKLSKEIIDTWKKSKKVPDSYAEVILSAVNYSGSANGTLLARVVGLTAPLIPPRIQIGKAQSK